MREYIRELLAAPLDEVLSIADRVRMERVGNEVRIRALLETSNVCSRNCAYCGLGVFNTSLQRYSMSAEEILNSSRRAFDVGYKTVVLQSGEQGVFDLGFYTEIVREISKWGMTVTLSLGELDFNDYKKLREAGAERYLLKHETADTVLYAKLHEGYSLSSRLECVRSLKDLGYEYGGGFLIGLPEETEKSVEDNLILLKELECDMIGIGRYIPHRATPLGNGKSGDVDMTLRAVAIARILLPDANIPVTTSLSLSDRGYSAFDGGANVIMVNITPDKYRSLYDIYPSERNGTDIEADRRETEKRIIGTGRIPD